MKHCRSPKLRSGKSVPTPFLCGSVFVNAKGTFGEQEQERVHEHVFLFHANLEALGQWVYPAKKNDSSVSLISLSSPFFEGNGPARQGLYGLDFRPCLSSELSSPSVPLAVTRARHTRQQWSCGPEATAAL